MRNTTPGSEKADNPPGGAGRSRSRKKNTTEIDLAVAGEGDVRHVLVVEDDPIILELLQDVLRSAGYTVLIAKNAPDGLAMFAENVDTTVCVILDYGIPGMHAARLLERLQEVDPEVKVILSSGYPQNFIREDFPVDRLAGFMAKPYDPQVLIAELKRLPPRAPAK